MAERPLEVTVREQGAEKLGIAGDGARDKIARGKYRRQTFAKGRRRAGETGARALVGVELSERALDEGRQLRAGSGPRGQFQMLPPRS